MVPTSPWSAKAMLVSEKADRGFRARASPGKAHGLWTTDGIVRMLREPLLVPGCGGIKVTPIVHSAPAATEPPQVFVCAKSLAFAPVAARPVILNAAFPVLVRVIDWMLLDLSTGSLPKLRLAEDKLKAGALTVLGTASVAPPPQEVEKMTSAVKIASRAATITSCDCRALGCTEVALVTTALRV